MTGDIHIGDSIQQSGAGSIGKIEYSGPAEPQAALADMIRLAAELRAQVGTEERDTIDEAARAAAEDGQPGSGTLRRAVHTLITAATRAGAVGVPLLDAAVKVKTLFGL